MASSGGVLSCPPLRRLADAPSHVWLGLHLLLYFLLDLATLATLNTMDTDSGGHVVSTVLRWYWFRVAALATFVTPALLLALLLSDGDVAAVQVVLPMHILMGLLVVRPSWPDATPSMDGHRW
jgi:hypothetical protein